MASQILKLKEVDPKTAVKTAVHALLEGKLIVFPTETVYGLGALASNKEAVERLITAKGRRAGHALPLAVSGLKMARRFSPEIDPVSERLARRCWPGPLTLVLNGTSEKSPLQKYPESVRKAIMPNSTIGFRVPGHAEFIQILEELDEPIVLTSANLTGENPATNAEMALDALGNKPDLFLDDGPAQIGSPSTVIEVQGNKINVIREGAISKKNIKRLTAKIILFVCTGNTCRSPMAEVLCSKILAEELHCDLDDLEENGYIVMSAGLATTSSSGATPEARDVMRSCGLSLDEHESQPLSPGLLQFADLIFVMSLSHRRMILSTYPEAVNRVQLLSVDGNDIADPLGGSFDVYKNCARQIEEEIKKRLPLIL